MFHYRLFAFSLVALLGQQYVAAAADIPAAPVTAEFETQNIKPDEWRFSASPYFWAAGTSGTAG